MPINYLDTQNEADIKNTAAILPTITLDVSGFSGDVEPLAANPATESTVSASLKSFHNLENGNVETTPDPFDTIFGATGTLPYSQKKEVYKQLMSEEQFTSISELNTQLLEAAKTGDTELVTGILKERGSILRDQLGFDGVIKATVNNFLEYAADNLIGFDQEERERPSAFNATSVIAEDYMTNEILRLQLQGVSKEGIQNHLKEITETTEPLFSPTDVLVAVASAPSILARMGLYGATASTAAKLIPKSASLSAIKAMTVADKQMLTALPARELGKVIAGESAIASAAIGGMVMAENVEANPLLGALGGTAAYALGVKLASGSRAGFNALMKEYRLKNTEAYNELINIASTKTDAFSKAVMETHLLNEEGAKASIKVGEELIGTPVYFKGADNPALKAFAEGASSSDTNAVLKGQVMNHLFPGKDDLEFPDLTPLLRGTAASNIEIAGATADVTSSLIARAIIQQGTEAGTVVSKALGLGNYTPFTPIWHNTSIRGAYGQMFPFTINPMNSFSNISNTASILGQTAGAHATMKMMLGMSNVVNPLSNAALFQWRVGNNLLTTNTIQTIAKDAEWSREIATGMKGFFTRLFGSGKSLVSTEDKIADLIISPTFAKGQKDRISKFFTDEAKRIFSGITKEDSEQVFKVFDYAAQVDAPIHAVGGGVVVNGQLFPMRKAQVDALFEAKALFNTAHAATNITLVSEAKARGMKISNATGFKYAPEKVKYGTIIANGQRWTKDLENQGYKVFREIGTKEGRMLLMSPSEVQGLRDPLPSDEFIKYREDWLPRYYTDKYFILKARVSEEVQKPLKTSTKLVTRQFAVPKISVEYTEPFLKDADLAVNQLQSKAAPGEIYFALRQGETDFAMDFLIDRKYASDMFKTSPRLLREIEQVFAKNGLSTNTIQKAIKALDKSIPYGGKHAMGRRQEAIPRFSSGKPMLLDSEEAMAKYLDETSSRIAYTGLRRELATKWKNTFGEFMNDPNNLASGIKEASRLPSTMAADRNNVETIYNNILLPALGSMSSKELAQVHAINGIMDNLYASSPTMRKVFDAGRGLVKETLETNIGVEWPKKLAKRLETLDPGKTFNAYNIGRTAQSWAATTFLGLYSISQLPVQASGMLTTMGYYKPGVSTRALDDFGNLLRQKVFGMPSKNTAADVVLDLFEKSGFDSAANYSALKEYGNTIITGNGIFRTIGESNPLFFKAGETANKFYAFSAAYHSIADEIASGSHKLFKNVAQLDTPEGLKAIVSRASETSLLLNSTNASQFTKHPLLGPAFQFKQFSTQMLELLLGKGTTMGQRMGIATAWLAAFGTAGVPLSRDIYSIYELARASAMDDPNLETYDIAVEKMLNAFIDATTKDDLGPWREFIKDGAKKGALYTLSDGSIDIVSRVSLSSLVGNFIEARGVADLVLGPTAPTIRAIIGMAKGGSQGVVEVMDTIFSGDNPTVDQVLRIAQETASGFSGPRSLTESARMLYTGELRDVHGRLVKSRTTVFDALNQGLGFKQGDIIRLRQMKWDQIKADKIGRDILRNRMLEIGRVAQKDQEFAAKMLSDDLVELSVSSPQWVQPYMKEQAGMMNAQFIPERDRYLQDLMIKYAHNPTAFGLVMDELE